MAKRSYADEPLQLLRPGSYPGLDQLRLQRPAYAAPPGEWRFHGGGGDD